MAQSPSSRPLPLQPEVYTQHVALRDALGICERIYANRHPPAAGWDPPLELGPSEAFSDALPEALGLVMITAEELFADGWTLGDLPEAAGEKRGTWGRVSIRSNHGRCHVLLMPNPRGAPLEVEALKAAVLARTRSTFPGTAQEAEQTRLPYAPERIEVAFVAPDGMRVRLTAPAEASTPSYVSIDFSYRPPRPGQEPAPPGKLQPIAY